MTNLKAGESLTSGGYVRRADGAVAIPKEGKALFDAAKALGDLKGLTMAQIAEKIGNCDPIPAVKYRNGYVHSWSQPGFTFGVLFGHDNKAICIAKGSQELGGPPTPGLLARRASSPPTRMDRLAAWAASGWGEIHPQVICPHCQTRGSVRAKRMKVKQGVSGSKASGAVLTGGLSILATGLSRKGWVTQAHCGNCNTTWNL